MQQRIRIIEEEEENEIEEKEILAKNTS